jgi:hypothetical protein
MRFMRGKMNDLSGKNVAPFPKIFGYVHRLVIVGVAIPFTRPYGNRMAVNE